MRRRERMDANGVVKLLRREGRAENREGMARYGINVEHAYGISMPFLRSLAKRLGKDHGLAQGLWDSGIHEARILACLVEDPRWVGEEQMETWVRDFDSWDLCDQCCNNLFAQTPFANAKAYQWSLREEVYVKRAAFVLMAALAVHDKKASDQSFIGFLPVIMREATDDRNFVRKAVNWALRQIGKRNARLNIEAIRVAEELRSMDSLSARWIGADALHELKCWTVQARLARKQAKGDCPR